MLNFPLFIRANILFIPKKVALAMTCVLTSYIGVAAADTPHVDNTSMATADLTFVAPSKTVTASIETKPGLQGGLITRDLIVGELHLRSPSPGSFDFRWSPNAGNQPQNSTEYHRIIKSNEDPSVSVDFYVSTGCAHEDTATITNQDPATPWLTADDGIYRPGQPNKRLPYGSTDETHDLGASANQIISAGTYTLSFDAGIYNP